MTLRKRFPYHHLLHGSRRVRGAPASASRGGPILHLLYSVLSAGASLFLLPYYLMRSARDPAVRRHLRERLGFPPPLPHSTAPRLWVHAASVGEVQVARILIAGLREAEPARPIVLSVTTPAGRRVAAATPGGGFEALFYFPLDLPFAAGRALRRIRPGLFTAVETEIWPGFLRECRRLGIPHGIVNGRISARSFPRYRLVRPILRRALSGMSFLCMQDEPDAERIRALGAPPGRVRVTGNLKYDFRPDPEARDRLRARIGAPPGARLWVAGSTRSGEEAPLLRAFRRLRDRFPDLHLVLAPRHADRFEAVAQLLAEAGVPFRRLSRPDTESGWHVLLADTHGDLAHLYGLADAAFVGGSLAPCGGHNPIEPAAWGVPVLLGPHTENFAAIASDLLAAGGAIRVTDGESLVGAVARLLEDREARRRAAEAARTCARRHQGAVDRTVREVVAAGGAVIQVPAPPARRWIPALLPLAPVYGLAVAARNRRYDRSPKRAVRAEIPVVSLGNLTVGGTGKTPLAVFLARKLRAAGWRPAVVSRGYRRASRRLEEAVGAAGWPDAAAVWRLGDEPAWMAARLPGIPVIVCSDRLRAVRRARAGYGATLALLDDGYQHRRLHRDVDLLLIDSLDPFGNGRLLPSGPLREPPAAIRRASALLLTRWDLCPDPERLEGDLRRWTSPGVPLFRFRQRCTGLVPAVDRKGGGIEALAGTPALAFAGIGHPAAFLEELRRSGLTLVAAVWFRDHHPYTPEDRDQILRVAARRGAEVLLTTEKDRVRFPLEGCPLPVFALEVVQEPVEEEPLLAFLRARLPSPPAADPPGRGATR